MCSLGQIPRMAEAGPSRSNRAEARKKAGFAPSKNMTGKAYFSPVSWLILKSFLGARSLLSPGPPMMRGPVGHYLFIGAPVLPSRRDDCGRILMFQGLFCGDAKRGPVNWSSWFAPARFGSAKKIRAAVPSRRFIPADTSRSIFEASLFRLARPILNLPEVKCRTSAPRLETLFPARHRGPPRPIGNFADDKKRKPPVRPSPPQLTPNLRDQGRRPCGAEDRQKESDLPGTFSA